MKTEIINGKEYYAREVKYYLYGEEVSYEDWLDLSDEDEGDCDAVLGWNEAIY